MISSQDRIKEFVATGNTNPVSLNFPIAAATDVLVTAKDGDADPVELALNVDYSIGGTVAQWRAGAGTIIPIDIAAGLAVRAERLTRLRQSYNPVAGIALDHKALGVALDDATMRAQDNADVVADFGSRALLFPRGEAAGPLPSVDNLKGKFPAMDAGGKWYGSSGTGNDPNLRTDMADGEDAGSRLMNHFLPVAPSGSAPIDQQLFNILKRVALTPAGFAGGIGDAVYDAGAMTFSGTDASNALIAWASHPDPVKVLPPGNWLSNVDRLPFAEGSILQVDPEAWICGGGACNTGLLWLQNLDGFAADRLNLDMRGAPWASDGLGQVNDAITIVGCENVRIGAIRGRAIFDPANIDAAHCRGDSLLMLSQSERVQIGSIIGDGFPDALAYLNGDGQTAGVANAPLNDCTIGEVLGTNCMAGVTAKRGADNFNIGRIFLDGCDRVFTTEDAPPTVGTARKWSVDEIVGRRVRLDGAIVRYGDGSRIGRLDVEFAPRPGSLSGAAIRCGCDVQGTAGFVIESYTAIFDGSDPASRSAGVVIEERSGTPCSDVRIVSGRTVNAHWRVVELEATHLRTRVGDVQGINDGASDAVRLLAATGRHVHFHADGSLLLNTDIRFTKNNIGLYARDVDGTYRNLLVDCAQMILTMSGAAWGSFTTTGVQLVTGKVVTINNQTVLAGLGAAVADPAALTYAAPAGGGTVDAQARASLVQLAADVTDLRTQQIAHLARARAATPSIAP